MINQVKKFLKGFIAGQKIFGENIQFIINIILLSFIYLVGVGLTAIVAKIFKKRFLDLKIDKKKLTYWEDLNLDKEPIENYYRQF